MPFDLSFYNLFNQNLVQGDRYCIKLKDGRVLEGVPTAGSMLNINNPDAEVFFVDLDDSTQETFCWGDFVGAEKIS